MKKMQKQNCIIAQFKQFPGGGNGEANKQPML